MSGPIKYWNAYAIQIASYSQSLPYDTVTEERGTWPFEIDQTHALIAHLDVLGALDGRPSCELIYVDLAAGRAAGEIVVAAKAWGARKDVFSVARATDEADQADEDEQIAAPDEPRTVASVEQLPAEGAPPPSVGENVTADAPTGDGGDGTAAGTSSAVTPTPAEQHAQLRQAPDEGGDGDFDAFDSLEYTYKALPADRLAQIKHIVEKAQQHGVGFHAKAVKSQRRYYLIEALVLLADNGDIYTVAEDGTIQDEMPRAVLATIIGDPAWFPNVELGALIGSLDVHEARLFAARCAVLCDTTVPASIDDNGHIVLDFA